jgi:AcrR family transcriptional regulator
MPKITFHNLEAEKQLKLMTAIQNEFSRVPLHLALVSNIVKEAKIPRGSFYQYFDDKEDAYYFLLSQYVLELNEQFVHFLKKNEGDVFEAVTDLFQLIIEDEDHFYLMRNSFLNLSYKVENKLAGIFQDRSHTSENLEEITPFLKLDLLNVNNEEDLKHLIKILSSVTFRNFVEKYAKNLSNEEALMVYKREIQLLKKGLAK